MSLDPKVFRPEDLAALVADTVLRLVGNSDHDQDALETAAELAQALHDGETRGLANQGAQYWYWVAATEAALAASAGPASSPQHKGLAFRALRMAKSLYVEAPLTPVLWADADIEEFWKVSLAAQALAVTWLRAARMTRSEVLAEIGRIASIAADHGAARLAAAAVRVAYELKLDLPVRSKSPITACTVQGMHPAEIASRMIRNGRPDLCEPAMKRSALAELAGLAGVSGPAAVRLAELNEAVAVADAWPFMFGGPPVGWGALRSEPLFDSLFYRAAAIGAGRRTGSLSWRDVSELVTGRSTLWLRELEPDLSMIVGVSCTPRDGWRSSLVRLPRRACEALGDLMAGRVQDLRAEAFEELGELLLEPLLECATRPQLLTAVLSPSLRCLPLEALHVGGQVLADATVVSVVPSLLAMATRTARSLETGDRLRVLGLFDQSLSGALAEIEVLRDLVRRGHADGVGFNGPIRLRHALENDSWDLLTVAAHGTIRSGAPLLQAPAGTLAIPELLEWTLPPVVNLGACRSAETTGTAVPLDWITAALRRGARSVIAARWSVPDRSTARIIGRFYVNLAEHSYRHAASAFWDAVRTERDRRAHPWHWAGLGLFGDEMQPLHQ